MFLFVFVQKNQAILLTASLLFASFASIYATSGPYRDTKPQPEQNSVP